MDLTTVHLATTKHINQTDFFNLKKPNSDLKQAISLAQLATLKDTLSNLLVENCLNKTQSQSKAKSKSTFKIEMSGSTRILLLKRDFQLEYEQQLHDCSKTGSPESERKFSLFHQVYVLFLLSINDVDKLIELNESVLLKESPLTLFKSNVIEFYLNSLNYLYYRECKLGKFMYKTKLYEIIKYVAMGGGVNCAKSLLTLLQITLIRFKLDSSSALTNHLIEGSDIDAMFSNTANKLTKNRADSAAVNFMLAHIYSNLIRLERVLSESFKIKSSQELKNALTVSNLGINHQIRRLFEFYLKLNAKSEHLWLCYFNFETSYNKIDSNVKSKLINALVSIYYQSIRNLPYSKIFYLKAAKYLPEQYNEIMNILYAKEIRVYLPIQELNVLLEPIRKPEEMEMDDDVDDKSEEDNASQESNESNQRLEHDEHESSSSDGEENDQIQDMSISESSSLDEALLINQ